MDLAKYKGFPSKKVYLAFKKQWEKRRKKARAQKKKKKSRSTTKGVMRTARRRYVRRGTSMKSMAKNIMAGLGVASVIGGGPLGALAGYVFGGVPGAAAGFFANELRGLFGSLGSSLQSSFGGRQQVHG